ncbi:MAG: response regulator [Gammaproteobacteria bacterium]
MTGAYFLFGLLGLELAVPPSNAGAVWPPAGIALASILLWGRSIAPGIFVGNFCISAWAFGFDNQPLLIYLATGFGATTNALMGAYLIKRWVGFPTELLEDRQIVLFLFLGGPLSCLIPATVGISAMTAGGIITPSEIPVNWFSWWVGDSIGVLVFTPLLLTLFANPAAIWRQRVIPVGIPLILSFILVAVFFYYIQKVEYQRHEQEFDNQSLVLSQALKHRIQDQAQSLYGIRNLLIGIPDLDEKDFRLFSQPVLKEFDELEAIQWLVYKPGQFNKTSLKTVYSEQKTNVATYSDPLPAPLIDRMIQANESKLLAKAYIETVDDHLIFLMPVYQNTALNKTSLKGIVSGMISIPLLIHQVFKTLDSDGIYLAISGTDNMSGYRIIYSNTSNNLKGDYRQYGLQVADQIWQLYFYRDSALAHSQTHWSMWWFLISGLLFTCLLGLGSLLLTGRYFKTERIVDERTADLLQAKTSAETANKTKDQFLAKISHELRTPLNGILGFTQLLQKNSLISGLEKQQIDIISHCSEDLLTLINDILDISAIENNKIKITPEKFDLSGLLDDICQLFSLKAKEKQLDFVTSIGKHPRYLEGDKKRIRQILSNLLNNAIKYTDQGIVGLTVNYHDGLLEFIVTDTGCGIADAHLNLIFSPFIQVTEHGTITEGIGIGLAICQELTKLMKGDIKVHSEPAIGSEFIVTLPVSCTDFENTSLIDEQNSQRTGGKAKINALIADDNEINLLLLSNLLDAQCCRIDSAMNGQEALSLIDRNHYDLAFIDLKMPVMGGIELVKKLRNKRNGLKMIAISAYADRQMIQEALNAGFNDYLTKPIDSDQLIRLIQTTQINHE